MNSDAIKSLTTKGINATEINEGNALLMSELYEEKVFTSSTMTKETILMILSCFMEKTKDDNNDTYNIYEVESIRMLSERICKNIEKTEKEQGISYKEWSLNYEYVPILHDLFNGTSIGTICENYEIMEGNLTRFLLKLLNIVDELKNIATLNNDTLLLEKLEEVRAYEFYKIAIPDSLYLHI